MYIFEGGEEGASWASGIRAVRKAACLDAIERIRQVPGVAETVLITSYPDLGAQASAAGADVVMSPTTFHYGRVLCGLVQERRPEAVVCLGGGSAPLALPDDWDGVIGILRSENGVVVTNNLVSSNVLGFRPAEALGRVELPAKDNFLGYLLKEAGLNDRLLPEGPPFNFDIDTATDCLVMTLHPNVGQRTLRAVEETGWDRGPVQRALEAAALPHCRVFAAGRVGPSVMRFIQKNLRWRLRVISEERGMKAFSAEPSGGPRASVRSLTGLLLDLMGPEPFFQYLAEACDLALIDTRVIFAHWGTVVDMDTRTLSDLGRAEMVCDHKVRLFTQAARDARIPVLLGGHSLVTGGLWVIAQKILD